MDLEKKSDNTKRDPQRMIKAVAALKRYIATYDQQAEYGRYTDGIFIDDILYGLGIALEPEEHKEGIGYEAFKKKLLEHLGR